MATPAILDRQLRPSFPEYRKSRESATNRAAIIILSMAVNVFTMVVVLCAIGTMAPTSRATRHTGNSRMRIRRTVPAGRARAGP